MPNASFVNFVFDATVQYGHMLTHRSDLESAANGVELLYAVDADVIKMFIDTGDEAQYGRVFRGDSLAKSAAISKIIATAVFFDLNQSMGADGNRVPLMIVAPIDREVASMWLAITNDLVRSPAPDGEIISETLVQIENAVGADLSKADKSTLEKLSSDLIELYYISGSVRNQHNLLSLLFSEARIADEEVVRQRLRESSPIKEALRPLETVGEAIHFYQRVEEIFQALLSEQGRGHERQPAKRRVKANRDEKKVRHLHDDALALARVELWNERIRADDGKAAKVLYITGSPTIHRAAKQLGSRRANSTLARDFVRHPRSLLARPDIIRGTSPEQNADRQPIARRRRGRQDFFTALQTLVVGLGADQNVGDWSDEATKKFVEQIGGHGLSNSSFEASKVRKSWNDFAEVAKKAYRPNATIADFVRSCFSGVAASNTVFEKMEEIGRQVAGELQKELNRNWDLFFAAAVNDATIFGPGKNVPKRSVPPIYFDSWPITEALVRKISRWHSPAEFDVQIYNDALKAIMSETGGRAHGYEYYVVHAALFAARERWAVCVSLCDRAVGQIDFDLTSIVDGREAYFLRCYAARHSARRIDDLGRARQSLRLALEAANKGKVGRPDLETYPERFAAESAAIDVMDWLFRRFARRETGVSDALRMEAYELFSRLKVVEQDMRRVRPRPDDDRVAFIATKVLTSVYVNMLSLWLSEADPLTAVKRYDARAVLQKLKNTSLRTDVNDTPVETSLFVRAIILLADILLDPSGLQKHYIETQLAANLDVFPYDQNRFRHFVSAISRALGYDVFVPWLH